MLSLSASPGAESQKRYRFEVGSLPLADHGFIISKQLIFNCGLKCLRKPFHAGDYLFFFVFCFTKTLCIIELNLQWITSFQELKDQQNYIFLCNVPENCQEIISSTRVFEFLLHICYACFIAAAVGSLDC